MQTRDPAWAQTIPKLATDVVFPSFMWIVGVALTLSLSRRIAAGASRAQLLAQAFRRALILYVLGLLVYAFPNFNLSTQRLLGVLQRIAICYLLPPGPTRYLATLPAHAAC